MLSEACNKQIFRGERSEALRERQVNLAEGPFGQSIWDEGGERGWQSDQGLVKKGPHATA